MNRLQTSPTYASSLPARGRLQVSGSHIASTLLCAAHGPVAQKVEHSVFHRGGVGSYPTRSNLSGQVTPSN
jgi:hypothetical protein